MKTTTAFVFLSLALSCASAAYADTFGSDVNMFDIEFVTIGNPGNAADTTGNPNPAGSVDYTYRIGKYEISEDMIDKANASGGLGIPKDVRGPNKPATSVSWNQAARFINWLNTSTGSTPAYKFAIQPGESGYSSNANIQLWTPSDAGYNPSDLYRNSLAKYFLPSDDEWYKAAYYDPIADVYYDYPTGSDTAPTKVASGTTAGTAVWGWSTTADPADITLAGGLSPYGTMAQGGNVWDWEETDFDLVNDSISSTTRPSWGQLVAPRGRHHVDVGPGPQRLAVVKFNDVGFRVAGVVWPNSLFPGDYNSNGIVDAADYTTWRDAMTAGATSLPNDPTPGTVDESDFLYWRGSFRRVVRRRRGCDCLHPRAWCDTATLHWLRWEPLRCTDDTAPDNKNRGLFRVVIPERALPVNRFR